MYSLKNLNKSNFLGTSYGSACHKLRKAILFKLVQDTNQNNCFRCGIKIASVDELSIEHKEPWENRSVDLFWDLNNIAFSHLKCNRPHNNKGGQPRKQGEEGTAWCVPCRIFKPVSEFHKNSYNWNGLHHYCKECMSKRNR